MTKKEMIKELVRAWVVNYPVGSSERANAFVYHGSLESRINRRWTADGVRWFFGRYEKGEDINYLMAKMD